MTVRPRPLVIGTWRGVAWAVLLASLGALADALGTFGVKGGAVLATAVAVAMIRSFEGAVDDRRETRAMRRARHPSRRRRGAGA